MDFETILYDVSDRVATITLNRPASHNAFTVRMARELKQAWEAVKSDAGVVCVVVTGAGDQALCTGMDVADIASGAAREEAAAIEAETGRAFYQFLTAIHNECWKPVVTAVNGMVCGGGLHFVADSDLVVAAEHATFFDTHVKVGLIAGLEPVGLARRIPFEEVMRMALLGGAERMGAARAREIGLVGEVVPGEQLQARARELAGRIARHSPTALARTKRAIWRSLDRGLDAALAETWELIREHTAHPDLEEGARAFVERRKPRWAPYTES